jgi:magnesium transporter
MVSILDQGTAEDVAAVLTDITPDRAANVLRQLQPDLGLQVLCAFEPTWAKSVLEELEPVRAVILLARAEPEIQERMLGQLDVGFAKELRGLLSYSRDTAGGMMNPRPTVFRPTTAVKDAVDQLRKQKRRRIQDVFLVDDDGRLVGSVPMTDVVLADEEEPLAAIATIPTPSVPDTASREDVLEQLEQNRNLSLPVIDFDGRLLGVLRQEELLRAAQRDAAGNALLMVGLSKNERALAPFHLAVRNRLPWLLINLLTAFLAAAVVGLFEGTIATYTALAVLLPVVAGQSGNTGAQALAVTMRGLALREVRVHHWLRIAFKELAAGASNGLAVALTTGGAVYVWSGSPGLALVIGLSMVISMSAAGLSGALIPMVLTALRQDPAQSSSIVLTTVTDVVGFFSFLGIATVLSFLL